MLPLVICTHCWCILYSVLESSCQSLFHHAGQTVELMLLINLKQAQKLPLLPQTSPPPPLPCTGVLMVTRHPKAPWS